MKRSLIYSNGTRRVYLCTSRKPHCRTLWHIETEDAGQIVYSSKPTTGEKALADAKRQTRPTALQVSQAASVMARARGPRDMSTPLFEERI